MQYASETVPAVQVFSVEVRTVAAHGAAPE
jgi:hypothetical protein